MKEIHFKSLSGQKGSISIHLQMNPLLHVYTLMMYMLHAHTFVKLVCLALHYTLHTTNIIYKEHV